MPSSAVQIANRALTKLGDARILALTDDSNAARVINSMFDQVRDAELRRHRWKFAIKRTQLTADATAPDWGYTYQYELPADFLQIVQVNDIYQRPTSPNGSVMWQREGTKLLTDLPPQLKFRYVSRVTNPGLFDPMFVEAFACRLAFEACESLTQSSTKKQSAGDEYREALIAAMQADAIEALPDALPWGSWLDSREGPGGTLYGNDAPFYGASGFTVL